MKLTDLHPDNIRQVDTASDEFKDLVASIAGRLAAGKPPIVDPITYYTDDNGKHWIVSGHRRREACLAAGATDAPAYEVPFVSEQDLRLDQMVANMLRVDVSPIDKARTIYELMQTHHMEQKDIAAQLAKSEGWISKHLKLLSDLTPEIRQAVHEGKLSYNSGYEIATKLPAELQHKYADQIAATKTQRGVTDLCKSLIAIEEYGAPVQMQDAEPEAEEIVPEETPDEEVQRIEALFEMIVFDIGVARQEAKAIDMDISAHIARVQEALK